MPCPYKITFIGDICSMEVSGERPWFLHESLNEFLGIYIKNIIYFGEVYALSVQNHIYRGYL